MTVRDARNRVAEMKSAIKSQEMELSAVKNAEVGELAAMKAEIQRQEEALRAKQNPVAAAVKMSDLRNNMDISRLPAVNDKDIRRLEKYRKAYALLSE